MLINAMLIYLIGKIVTATDHNINKTIEELEKEKIYLLKQINEAIDDSVKSLQQANDSDSLVGLKYMEDLKEHMKRVNKTTIYTTTDSEGQYISNVENRRRLKHLLDPEKWKGKKTTKSKDIFDFESILKPNKPSSDWKDIMETRQQMQKKLDEWILERQKAKARLEKERLRKKLLKMSGVYEKCPRFGFLGRKKKSALDKIKIRPCKKCPYNMTKENRTDDEIRIMPKSRKKNYPCCRKCCKKSYLGCL